MCKCNPGRGSDEGSTATFVQADSACFRDLVQRLTGPTPSNSPAHRPTQKLHERRKCNNPKIEINDRAQIQHQPFQVLTSPPMLHVGSSKGGYWAGSSSCPASPSDMMLLSPLSSLHASLVSTPVTAGRSKKRASPSAMELLNPEEEERAIKEKRFYLHPSPQSKPRLAAGPELLPLFPLKALTASTSYER